MNACRSFLVLLALLDIIACLRVAPSRGSTARMQQLDEPCMLMVHMQSPAGPMGARFWSDVLMESGAMCVSLSDGEAGTAHEKPIFSSFDSGSREPELETWSELLDAQ